MNAAQKLELVKIDTHTEVIKAANFLYKPGQVFELRAFGVLIDKWNQGKYYGYYNDFEKFAQDVTYLTQYAKNMYSTINPVEQTLLARCNNKYKKVKGDKLTDDTDITGKSVLSIDVDPERKSGISATAEQLDLALERTLAIRDDLRKAGFPEPAYGMTGNGGRLWYKINEPVEDDGLIGYCLDSLALMYNDDLVKVDTTLRNPSRIDKIPGTWARKGDELPEMGIIHRQARLIDVPTDVHIVPHELLVELSQKAQQKEKAQVTVPERKKSVQASSRSNGYYKSPYDVKKLDDWKALMYSSGLKISKEGPYNGKHGAGYRIEFSECPFHPDHRDYSVFAIWYENGPYIAGCNHNSCQHWGYNEFRKHIEPGWIPYEERSFSTKESSSHDLNPGGDGAIVEPEKPGEDNYGALEQFLTSIGEKVSGADLYDALLPYVLYLDDADYKRASKAIKDALGHRVNLNALKKLIASEKRRRTVDRQLSVLAEAGKPLIDTTGDPTDVVDQMASAMKDYNNPPVLFTRSGEAVHIVLDEDDRPGIKLADIAVLDYRMSRAATFTDQGKHGVRQVDPPMRYLKQLPIIEKSPFPPVKSIIESPIIKPNGEILCTQGYDADTRLYYQPMPGFNMPPIPEKPTRKDVQKSVELFNDLLYDFNFSGPSSKANYIGLLLTTLCREMFGKTGANVPLSGINAPVKGSGKTLLSGIKAWISTGRSAATMSMPTDEAEWRKRITAILLKSSSVVVIDNIKGRQ